jgi:hypothetical protein
VFLLCAVLMHILFKPTSTIIVVAGFCHLSQRNYRKINHDIILHASLIEHCHIQKIVWYRQSGTRPHTILSHVCDLYLAIRLSKTFLIARPSLAGCLGVKGSPPKGASRGRGRLLRYQDSVSKDGTRISAVLNRGHYPNDHRWHAGKWKSEGVRPGCLCEFYTSTSSSKAFKGIPQP